MKRENKCKPYDRYLYIYQIFSDELIEEVKRECLNFNSRKNLEKDDAFFRFTKWGRQNNEVALFTIHAYASFQIPKDFDCIFDIDNPENVEYTECILSQSIYECLHPINKIEGGHKHLCLFKFKKEVPGIIHKLHVKKEKISHDPQDMVRLGICSREDYNDIKDRILYLDKLKKRHGPDWWKYDREAHKKN
ncbi:hypothetical protein [Fulvitalea axinellae]